MKNRSDMYYNGLNWSVSINDRLNMLAQLCTKFGIHCDGSILSRSITCIHRTKVVTKVDTKLCVNHSMYMKSIKNFKDRIIIPRRLTHRRTEEQEKNVSGASELMI